MNKQDLQNEIESLFQQRNVLQKESRAAEASPTPIEASISEIAFATFSKRGIPDQRFEEWKYSAQRLFRENSAIKEGQTASSKSMPALSIKGAFVLTIEDGEFVPEMSSDPNVLPGVRIQLVDDENFDSETSIADAMKHVVGDGGLPFATLQTAIEEYSMAIYVDAEIEVPIHIRYITNSLSSLLISTPTVVIIANPNSKITVVEEHFSHQPGNTIVTSVTRIVAHQGSTVNYVKLDYGVGQKSIAYTSADVFSGANVNAYTACLSGGFVRNDLHVRLLEPSADAHLYGVSVLDGDDLADNHTVVDHVAPHCTSRELYKGLYGGRSVGVFNGKIYVRPDAQKTLAYQSNHSLLLSDSAQINTKPQLEIWADDVKCSHGATTGQLDETAMFYLRSRGIGYNEAKQLLTNAFVGEVVDRFPIPVVREFVQHQINQTLHLQDVEF